VLVELVDAIVVVDDEEREVDGLSELDHWPPLGIHKGTVVRLHVHF